MCLHGIEVYYGWLPTATNDAGSGSSHRCRVTSGSSLPPWWFRQWPTPRYTSYWYGWSAVYQFGSGCAEDMEAVKTFPFVPLFPSLLFYSLHLFFGSRPGTNGIGTGCYRLPMEVEFPRAPDQPKGHHWAIPIGCGTYGFVRLHTLNGCLITPFHSISFISLVLALAAQEVCAKRGG